MALVKAHITLDPHVSDDPQARSSILDKILQVAHLSEINQKRFERYGILTGMVDGSLLEAIRRIPHVGSCPSRLRLIETTSPVSSSCRESTGHESFH